MARVIIPQNARTYNQNPQGSSTTTVMMKAQNPFENRNVGRDGMTPIMRAQRGSLAGLGADPPLLGPPSPAQPEGSTGTGINWGAIAAATATAIQPLASAEAQRLITKGSQQIPGASGFVLPVGQQPYPPKPASKLPWILTGVGVLGLVVAVVLVMRKRK